ALDLAAALGESRFDVVVCADVLEHLRDPARVLAALPPLLAPGGYLVASVPNVAHASVVAELLQGRFPYRPQGLLDDTHVRFFTREAIERCLEAAGWVIDHLERVRVEPEQTEFRTDLGRFPPEVARQLLAGEESRTYQFVLRARPAPDGGAALREAGARALGAAPVPAAEAEAGWRREVRAVLDALLARLAFVEEERRYQAGRLATLEEVTAERDR